MSAYSSLRPLSPTSSMTTTSGLMDVKLSRRNSLSASRRRRSRRLTIADAVEEAKTRYQHLARRIHRSTKPHDQKILMMGKTIYAPWALPMPANGVEYDRSPAIPKGFFCEPEPETQGENVPLSPTLSQHSVQTVSSSSSISTLPTPTSSRDATPIIIPGSPSGDCSQEDMSIKHPQPKDCAAWDDIFHRFVSAQLFEDSEWPRPDSDDLYSEYAVCL